jgi:hypothetical protein
MTLLTKEFKTTSALPSAHDIDDLRAAEQLLIEEARRRQRHRQHWIGAVLASVAVVGALFYATSGASPTVRPKSTPAHSVSLAAFPTCGVAHLHASFFGQPEGAAGTIYFTLKVVNRGPECTLPPVAVRGFNTSTAAFVGPWSRVYDTSGTKTDIATGHAAYVPVGVAQTANYPSSLCRAARVNGLRVAEAGNRATIGTVPLHETVCTVTQSLHTQSASLSPNGD